MRLYTLIQVNETAGTRKAMETGLTLTAANRRVRELPETPDTYYMATAQEDALETGATVEIMERGQWVGPFTVTGRTGRTPGHVILTGPGAAVFEFYADAPFNIRPTAPAPAPAPKTNR